MRHELNLYKRMTPLSIQNLKTLSLSLLYIVQLTYF